MKACRSLRLLVLMMGLTVAASGLEAGEGSKSATTMFKDPPNPSEVLEALGEKPKIKYRGTKTRAIVIDSEASAAPAAASAPSQAYQTPPDVADYPSASQPSSAPAPAAYTPPPAQAPVAYAPPPQQEQEVAEEPREERRPVKQHKPAKSPSTYAKKPKVAFPLTFDAGSASLSPQAMSYVDSMAAAMQQKPDLTLHISGHTDVTGGDEVNLPLSLRRAEAVKQYLLEKHNIDGSRLSVAGVGSYELLIKSNPKAEENRRVEFVKSNN